MGGRGMKHQDRTVWQTVFRMSAAGGHKAVFTTVAEAQEWCRGKRGLKVSIRRRRVHTGAVGAERRLEAAAQ